MDIIFINGKFLSQQITGVQRYAREIVKALDRFHFRWAVQMILLVPQKYDESYELSNIEIRPCGVFEGTIWEQLELPYHARGGFLLNLCNCAPVVKSEQTLTIHDAATAAVPDTYSLPFRLWYGFMHRLLGKRLEHIFTDTDFSRQELHKYYQIPLHKLHVVHLGIDHIKRVQNEQEGSVSFHLPAKKFVLAVSSVKRQKNFRLILQAAAKRPELIFVIVGSKENKIFQQETLGTHGRNVIFTGYITDEQLVYLYHQAGCFVFPSLYEGFGMPPLEAMSCGCPVVVARKEPLMEVCGEAAAYCDPHDPDNLLATIDAIFADDVYRKQLTRKGLERADEFTWDRAAGQIMETLQR